MSLLLNSLELIGNSIELDVNARCRPYKTLGFHRYATPLCTPTRVMIMSGLYPNRTGYKALIGKDDEVRLPASIRTFGHDFHAAGYATAIACKWQLGQFDECSDQPIQHGFGGYSMWTWF